jgi:hypothetical protein
MVDRGKLLGVPAFRWLPAMSRLEVEYGVVTAHADVIPEALEAR